MAARHHSHAVLVVRRKEGRCLLRHRAPDEHLGHALRVGCVRSLRGGAWVGAGGCGVQPGDRGAPRGWAGSGRRRRAGRRAPARRPCKPRAPACRLPGVGGLCRAASRIAAARSAVTEVDVLALATLEVLPQLAGRAPQVGLRDTEFGATPRGRGGGGLRTWYVLYTAG